MSQNHTGLNLKNTGSSPCTLYGYPGVSWVAGAHGQQVGPGATRAQGQPGAPEKTVTLAPGAVASAPLDIADYQVASKSECQPVAVRGLRVYPPGEKSALFIPASGDACSKPISGSNMLSVGWLQSGTQPTN